MSEDKTIIILCNGSILLTALFLTLMMGIFFIMPSEPCYLHNQFEDPKHISTHVLFLYASVQAMTLFLPTVSCLLQFTWFMASVVFMQRSLRILS